MSSFPVHLMGGTAVASGIALAGFFSGLNVVQALAAGIVCIVGSVLPDIDSDTGKPLRIIVQGVSILTAVLVYNSFTNRINGHPEYLVVLFPTIYFVMAFPVASIIKRMTIHRGIWHSLPMGLLASLIIALSFIPSGIDVALWFGSAMFAGIVTHLILDELNSITFKFGFIPTVKKSFGTALKLHSSFKVTFLVYFLCTISLSYLIYITKLTY